MIRHMLLLLLSQNTMKQKIGEKILSLYFTSVLEGNQPKSFRYLSLE